MAPVPGESSGSMSRISRDGAIGCPLITGARNGRPASKMRRVASCFTSGTQADQDMDKAMFRIAVGNRIIIDPHRPHANARHRKRFDPRCGCTDGFTQPRVRPH